MKNIFSGAKLGNFDEAPREKSDAVVADLCAKNAGNGPLEKVAGAREDSGENSTFPAGSGPSAAMRNAFLRDSGKIICGLADRGKDLSLVSGKWDVAPESKSIRKCWAKVKRKGIKILRINCIEEFHFDF